MKKLFKYFAYPVIVIALPVFVFAQSTNSITRNLYIGIRNSEVTLLQQKLQELRYFPKTVQPTGYFGLITRKAVQDFQKANGVPTTGYVGPLTRNALSHILLTPPPIGDPAIRILSPNGGESFAQGGKIDISWDGISHAPPYHVKLWMGSELIQYIAFNYFSSSPYRWVIPTTLAPSSDYSIEVISGSNSDKSNAPFSIIK